MKCEINLFKIGFSSPIPHGNLVVVEWELPERQCAKVVKIPRPSFPWKPSKEEAIVPYGGLAVPYNRGRLIIPDFGRFHVVSWKSVATGGGSNIERGYIAVHGILTEQIPFKYSPVEYYNLLLGRGFFN